MEFMKHYILVTALPQIYLVSYSSNQEQGNLPHVPTCFYDVFASFGHLWAIYFF